MKWRKKHLIHFVPALGRGGVGGLQGLRSCLWLSQFYPIFLARWLKDQKTYIDNIQEESSLRFTLSFQADCAEMLPLTRIISEDIYFLHGILHFDARAVKRNFPRACCLLENRNQLLIIKHGAAKEGANPKVRRLKKWTCHILVHTMG